MCASNVQTQEEKYVHIWIIKMIFNIVDVKTKKVLKFRKLFDCTPLMENLYNKSKNKLSDSNLNKLALESVLNTCTMSVFLIYK